MLPRPAVAIICQVAAAAAFVLRAARLTIVIVADLLVWGRRTKQRRAAGHDGHSGCRRTRGPKDSRRAVHAVRWQSTQRESLVGTSVLGTWHECSARGESRLLKTSTRCMCRIRIFVPDIKNKSQDTTCSSSSEMCLPSIAKTSQSIIEWEMASSNIFPNFRQLLPLEQRTFKK